MVMYTNGKNGITGRLWWLCKLQQNCWYLVVRVVDCGAAGAVGGSEAGCMNGVVKQVAMELVVLVGSCRLIAVLLWGRWQ